MTARVRVVTDQVMVASASGSESAGILPRRRQVPVLRHCQYYWQWQPESALPQYGTGMLCEYAEAAMLKRRFLAVPELLSLT